MHKKRAPERKILILSIAFATAHYYPFSHSCIHTDTQSGLSWSVPNQLCIENRDTKQLTVEGIAIKPGKSYTFLAQETGILHILYAKNVYKLSYPTCNCTIDTTACSKKETTTTITTDHIKAAINELQREQKEVSWLRPSNTVSLKEKGPIDEICIINDTPLPVKLQTNALNATSDTDTRPTQPQNIEPGHSYQAVVSPAPAQARTRKEAPLDTITIDDTLGTERQYAVTIMRRSTENVVRGSRTPHNNTVNQVAFAISALQRIKSGISIERLDSK